MLGAVPVFGDVPVPISGLLLSGLVVPVPDVPGTGAVGEVMVPLSGVVTVSEVPLLEEPDEFFFI